MCVQSCHWQAARQTLQKQKAKPRAKCAAGTSAEGEHSGQASERGREMNSARVICPAVRKGAVFRPDEGLSGFRGPLPAARFVLRWRQKPLTCCPAGSASGFQNQKGRPKGFRAAPAGTGQSSRFPARCSTCASLFYCSLGCRSCFGAPGASNQNKLPRPTSLCAPKAKPWRTRMALQIESPSPEPCLPASARER